MSDRIVHSRERRASPLTTTYAEGQQLFHFLSFQPKASTNYVILMGAQVAVSVAAAQAMIGMAQDSWVNWEEHLFPQAGTDYRSSQYMQLAEFGSSPPLTNFQIYQQAKTYGTSVTLDEGIIHAIEVLDTDIAYQFTTEISGYETSYQDWQSITINESGEYLIFAHALCNNGQTAYQTYIKATDGTTSWGEASFQLNSVAAIVPWLHVFRVTVSSPVTIKLQCKTSNASGAYYYRAGMLFAMDLSRCGWYDDTETTTRQISNAIVYQDKGANLTATPNNPVDHMVVASQLIDTSSSVGVPDTLILEGVNPIINWVCKGHTYAAIGKHYSNFIAQRRLQSHTSTNWKMQLRKVGGGLSITAGLTNTAICVFEIQNDGGDIFGDADCEAECVLVKNATTDIFGDADCETESLQVQYVTIDIFGDADCEATGIITIYELEGEVETFGDSTIRFPYVKYINLTFVVPRINIPFYVGDSTIIFELYDITVRMRYSSIYATVMCPSNHNVASGISVNQQECQIQEILNTSPIVGIEMYFSLSEVIDSFILKDESKEMMISDLEFSFE